MPRNNRSRRVPVITAAFAAIALSVLVSSLRSLEAAPGAFSLTRSGPRNAAKPTPALTTNPATERVAEANAPPIMAIAIASALDEKGTLVNPRFTFPPNEPQITAIVYVGKTNGGELKVAWYKVSEDEDGKPLDEKLFEHQIRVKSHERAFSVAKNPGGALGSGTYKVVATLEGQTKERKLDVATQAGSAGGQGKRPAAGTTGTVAQPAPAPAKTPEESCSMAARGLSNDDKDLDADTVEILTRGWCPEHFYVQVYATVMGPPKSLGAMEAGPDAPQAYFNTDPCGLSGPSDLPGTRITVTTRAFDSRGDSPKEAGSLDSVITLGDDTSAPMVNVIPTPARGSFVSAGQKISLQVTAKDERTGGSWQTGVRRIWLEAQPEGLDKPDEWPNPSRLPKPCDKKTWEQDFRATYTVPRKPPPIVEICAHAEDYADNPKSNCADFATGEWRGTLREHAQGSIYNDTVIVIFSFSEERDGTIKGAARVKMESAPQTFNECKSTRTLITPEPLLFPISGKLVDGEFHLDLPTDYRLNLHVQTDCPPPRNSGTVMATRSLGMSDVFYHPKVKAQDGATNSFHKPGAIDVSGTIEIHRAKQ